MEAVNILYLINPWSVKQGPLGRMDMLLVHLAHQERIQELEAVNARHAAQERFQELEAVDAGHAAQENIQ